MWKGGIARLVDNSILNGQYLVFILNYLVVN
jgi:hypothetical protein